MSKISKKSIIIMVISIILVFLAGTFAWLTWRSNETTLVLTVGDINSAVVTLKPYQINKEIVPALTYEGEEYIDVTATNNSTTRKKIKLYYVVESIDTSLVSSDFKYMITKSTDGGISYNEYITGDFSTASSNSTFYIMDENISGNTTWQYRVYIWLDGTKENSNVSSSKFVGELRAEILNGSDVVVDLPDGLIPIVYDVSSTNTIVKTVSSNDASWYDYDNKIWANAVLVSGTNTREYYQNNTGVAISEDDILAYFVYVPRYRYKIWTIGLSGEGAEQEIEIIFENKNTTKSAGSAVGEYLTHSAFTFGTDELNGIWVGKFETTGSSTEPTVKPDNKTLVSLSSSQRYTVSRLFENSTYGMSTTIDTHAAKNSEWGAITYLSHSKYGANREVYINNSSYTYTGRSGGNVAGSTAINTVYTDQTSTTMYNTYGFYTWDGYLLEYDTNTKSDTRDLTKVASTTGNIYGIYDMVGGKYDCLMAVFLDDNGNPRSGLSANAITLGQQGFNGISADGSEYTSGIDFPDAKYYDLYTTTDISTACNGSVCLGHALSEVRWWYYDGISFVTATNPWLFRGGVYSNSNARAGIFKSEPYYGDAVSKGTFRAILVSIN